MWTVWEFRSVDGKQVKRVLRTAKVDDRQYEHHFQRIIYRGADYEEAKAAL